MTEKWGMTGAAAAAAEEKEAKQIAMNKGGTWRFRLKPGEKAQITFLDGMIDPETGILAPFSEWEHTLKTGNRYTQFICRQNYGACPICESGDSPYLARYFTILDHRTQKGQDGKVFKNQKRLLVAKKTAAGLLKELADEHEGLRGWTFAVKRTDDKASIGNVFIAKKRWKAKELAQKLGGDKELIKPFDYQEVLPMHSEDDLRELGFGLPTGESSKPKVSETSDDDDDDFEF